MPAEDPIMPECRRLFEASGLSLDELGHRMGYPAVSARKSAWQFLRTTNDPRASMLRRFAGAIGIEAAQLWSQQRQVKVGPKSKK